MNRIADYQLEEYLRCPYKYYNKYILQQHTTHLSWRQLVQYAVNYVLHDYFMLPPESRSSASIRLLIDKYWTNKVHRFESNQHFHRVRETVTAFLLDNLSRRCMDAPIILFENVSVWIEELQVEMSMIFQLAHKAGGTLVIQKYTVTDNPDETTLFAHMANVVSQAAFEVRPDRIEVILPMTGSRQVFRPGQGELAASLDYIRLMHSSFREMLLSRRRMKDQECTACPFNQQSCSKPHMKVRTYTH